MSDEKEAGGWVKSFKASRLAFESILFEREVAGLKGEKLGTGLLVLGAIWLFSVALLAQWVTTRGYFFAQADAESFGAVLRFAAFFQSEGLWALIKPDLSGLAVDPPLYYLAFLPVLKFLTSNLNTALVLVNSFFLLLLAVAVFLAVKHTRPNAYGWLGAAFALAMPFVLETARRPAPEMALVALAAALYCCYLRLDEFTPSPWNFWFVVSLSLGFYSHRFFWVLALPLLPSLLSLLTSPPSRDDAIKGLFPGLLLNLPWYLCVILGLVSGLLPLRGELQPLWGLLGAAVSAVSLPLFVVGVPALAWLYFSVFTPFEKRRGLVSLAGVTWLLLAWGLGGDRGYLLFPALLFPLSVAVGVMTPHWPRKFLLYFVLALGAVNQSGLVPPLYLGGHRLLGLPLPAAKTYRSEEIISLLRQSLPEEGGLVGVYGSDSGLNAASLRFAASKDLAGARFEESPACQACPAVLVNRRPRRGAPPAKGAGNFAQVKSRDWFPGLFERKGEIQLADGSRIEVYAKYKVRPKPFEEGVYQLKGLALGNLAIEEGTLKIYAYRPETGRYARAEFFAPSASLSGGDVYGLTLEMRDLELAASGRVPVPAGLGNGRIVSAKVTEYALENFLAAKYQELSAVKVDMDGTIVLSGPVGGRELHAEFALDMPSPGLLQVRPIAFKYWFLKIPDTVLGLFTLRSEIAQNPYNLSFSGVRVKGNMLEFY